MEKVRKDFVLKQVKNKSYENFNNGNECFRKNSISKAISYYSRAIYLNDKEPIFYFQKAEAYMLIGQTDNAIANYIVCLKKIKDVKEKQKIKELNNAKQAEENKKLVENELHLFKENFKDEKRENEINNKELENINNLYNNITNFENTEIKTTDESPNLIQKQKKTIKRKVSLKAKKKRPSIKNKKDVVIIEYDRSNRPINNTNDDNIDNKNITNDDISNNEKENTINEEQFNQNNENENLNNNNENNDDENGNDNENFDHNNNETDIDIENEIINENDNNLKNESTCKYDNEIKENSENEISDANEIDKKNTPNKKDKKDKKKKMKKNNILLKRKSSLYPKKEDNKDSKLIVNEKKFTPEKKNPVAKNSKKTIKVTQLEITNETDNESEKNKKNNNTITAEPFCYSPFVSNRLCKALFSSGQLYVDSGIYDEALNCYKKILDIDKNYPHVNLILTCIYIEMQDREKALYFINECINNENDNANYYVIRAKFYQMNNEVSLVNKDRLKIIALNPNHPELEPLNKYIINMTTYYKNRADEMVQKGHFDIAISFLNLAIELDPLDWLLYFKRGLLLCDVEKYNESIRDFCHILYEMEHDTEKDIILQDHLSTIYNQFATFSFKFGDIDEAIDLLNQGLEYNLHNTLILRNLGDCYLTENKIDEALIEYKKLINEYKNKKMLQEDEKQEWVEVNRICGIIISCYAYNYYKELNFDEALRKFSEAISYYSFDVNFYIGRAKCYIHMNNFVKAAEDLWVVLNLDPENSSAQTLLEQLENNFNVTGQQTIPAFHPQKVLKNHPYTTLEAEKIIKDRKQKKINQIKNKNENSNFITSKNDNFDNIKEIPNTINNENKNSNSKNNKNNKSPTKYPECFESLAKQVPSYLVDALFQNIPKENVNVLKNKLTFSDPKSGGVKEKIDTNHEINMKKFKQNIILIENNNEPKKNDA